MNLPSRSDNFISVVQSHKGIIYKIANSYCKDPEDRKDLVQEVILQLWNSFDKYRDQFKYSTWIYRIALNTAISFYRKQRRRTEASSPFSDEILFIANPLNDIETDEKLLLLQKFIFELRQLDKALMLLYLDEKSYKEIADVMGISESNVATKISRIKIILKEKFLHVKL